MRIANNNSFRVIFHFLSILMCMSGAVNSGITLFWWATPFMLYLLIANNHGRDSKKFWRVVIFVAVCIGIAETNEINPLLHPVLYGGYVTILKDGYHITFKDGSGGFESKEDFEKNKVQSEYFKSEILKEIPLIAGQQFKVTEIFREGNEFTTKIRVVTNVGHFDAESNVVAINKSIESSWAKYLGLLMYWPTVPMVIWVIFEKICIELKNTGIFN